MKNDPSPKKSILIIDDEESICLLLARFLTQSGFSAEFAITLSAAREAMAARVYDAVILDQALPDGKGIDVIDELRSSNPNAAIVMITGQNDVPLAVEAMRRGADNFLTKPLRLNELLVFLQKSLDVSSLRRLAASRSLVHKKVNITFGVSEQMGRVMEIARLAAESELPVMINGETGVGKGILARWVHENGPRARGAYVEVDCPSFRGELLRSELYGHAKGAFTTAVNDHAGLLDAADGGTLFLDEIGEMDLQLQPQFLKVLEERSYRRIGETKVRKSDFRLICATNRDLEADSRAGSFRKDLLFRLQVLPITIPPLRERPEDIPVLVRHFLASCHYRFRGINPHIEQFLQSYHWPGNIRELQYVIERAVLVSRGSELTLTDFTGITDARTEVHRGKQAKGTEQLDAIRDALKANGDDVVKAAKSLGISRATFYRRMKKHGLT